MLMTNKLTLPVESRMQGDLHVRFGGRLWETYHRKVVRRPSPSLHGFYLTLVAGHDPAHGIGKALIVESS
jgi:hypothetical protein